METAVMVPTPVSQLNGDDGDAKEESVDVMEQLQKQRESLKLNLQEMDKNIKKLTGRDHIEQRRNSGGAENRRSSIRRVPLKRESLGTTPGDPPHKRRWGSTAFAPKRNLDEPKVEEEEKRPTIQSSVVVTAKAADETPPEPRKEDVTMKKRNKRMFGLLLGTLKQFKQDSQMKTETESKQEEKLLHVEEKVQREKEEIIERKKDLIETRQGKRLELEELEFKIAMTELNQELKAHYDQFTDFIQLKSTPRIFYKPALHNEKTEKLLKQSQASFRDSFEQRQKEISMCTEEDIQMARIPWEANAKRKTSNQEGDSKRLFRYNERTGRGREGRRRRDSNSDGKSVSDPIILDDAKTSEKDSIIVDGSKRSRKGTITVNTDDDEDNDVTIIDDKNVEEEVETNKKKFRSVVVGGDRGDPIEDALNDAEELSYTDWGQFVEDEQQQVMTDEREEVNQDQTVEGETKDRTESPIGDEKKGEELLDEKHKEDITNEVVETDGANVSSGETLCLEGNKETEHKDEEDLNKTGTEPHDHYENAVHQIHANDEELKPVDDVDEQNFLANENGDGEERLTDHPPGVDPEDFENAELDLPLEDIPIPPDEPMDANVNTISQCEKDDDVESRNIFTDLLPPVIVRNNENSTDDFEYAEQLLEEVVDKKMGLLSPSNSYSVIDERVFTKTNESFGSEVAEPTAAEISLFSKEYSWHEG